jgi:multidrug efflux system membrane fusion protein
MVLLLIVALLVAGCSDNKAAPVARPTPAAPVFVATAVLKPVPIEIQAIGTVEAYSTVSVKAQVGGEFDIGRFHGRRRCP